MSPKEFKALTVDFIREIDKRVSERGGTIEYVQGSDSTHFIKVDDGNIGSPQEVYELYNDGNFAACEFKGVSK
jgi:hypothetical protein